jgi:tripartite-type tricarboxylate transporter receptor subunit TctC
MRTWPIGFKIAVASLCLMASSVWAQTYPSKPVHIVVPFPPAGSSDILARLIAQKLGDLWPQSVVVDNKPGAGATIGTTFVAKSDADGHTLLLTSNAHAIAKSLYRNLQYHPMDDFAPVILVGTSPNVLVVNPGVAAKNVQEFIKLARDNPGKISFASAGPGSGSHLAGQLFKTLAGVDMVHVPYKGIGPGLQDVMAGRVSSAFAVLSGVNPNVKAGKLKALAVTSAERSSLAPELAAVQEFGLKGFDVVSWFGVFAPAKTPTDVVRKINQDIAKILGNKATKEQVTKLGVEVKPGEPDEFGRFVKADWDVWDKVIKDAGIQIE